MSGEGDDGVFDVCGPLPTGVTVLEASAGTGKTFTIAALAARYVADGLPLEHLLLVTFTRMATGELRERVRERLVTAEAGLAGRRDGTEVPADDEVLQLLADGDPSEVEHRRVNLSRALADFDAATIATTHGFCQHVLRGLGVMGDVEADTTLVDHADDLVAEVVDDLYLRKFHQRGKPPFTRSEALAIAHAAIANPRAPLEPEVDSNEGRVLRQRLAVAVRDEVERRKRRLRLITYDDLLTRLASTLRDEVRGPSACARLRDRYRVVLVDEFQDTDPVQWEIVRRAFGDGRSTLVLIGDPKQAIYAFRGADVYAYLDAASTAGRRATLAVNWRSDQGLLDAYDAWWRPTRLGHEGIVYRTVEAAPPNRRSRLHGGPCATPLRVRVVHRDDGRVTLTPKEGWASSGSAREHIATDLAADVVRLLSSDAEVTIAGAGADDREPLRPGHLAILVRTNRQAVLVREALDGAGVPAVINGAGSVFAAPTARDWLTLLEALERPSSVTRLHAVALTPFVGWDAATVSGASDDEWEAVHARIHRWANVLRRSGVASLFEVLTHTEALPARLLERADGERQLTDLRHVGQLLHHEVMTEHLGITALTAWLRERIDESRRDAGADERARRLESDAEAVQVLTIHRSKGLEFPIVYFPYLWDTGWDGGDRPAVYHDPDRALRRSVDVGMSGRAFANHQRLELEEQRGEDLRLTYVALTRARHQAVVWWASSSTSGDSPLGRLLFARDEEGNVDVDGSITPDESEVRDYFDALAQRVPGRIVVERADGGDEQQWHHDDDGPRPLGLRTFDRPLDLQWRRTSYSGITAGVHEANVASEAEERGVTDEDLGDEPALMTDDGGEDRSLREVVSPLRDMPGGAEVGSLVHAVLEDVDFAAGDLDAELEAQLDEQSWRTVELGPRDAVVAGLRAAIETPLGPLTDDRPLRSISRGDRLDELDFELPLVGGDQPVAELSLAAVARVLEQHLPDDDVLAGYAGRLREPALARDLRGYLVGSIDLVLRTRANDGTPRFTVVDYKTNWLGDDGEMLSAWHYRPAALTDAMQRAHYPLQALLYNVALHRYLRWRLPAYQPHRHLGGVLYLFLRGMTGAGAPRVGDQPCGVFSWRPPHGLVVALSDLFDDGAVAE